MTKKTEARSLMRKQLGKKSADAFLNKLDQMAKKGASARTIERILAKKIEANIIPSLHRAVKRGVSEGISAIFTPAAVKSRSSR
jgi:hypothetical protein